MERNNVRICPRIKDKLFLIVMLGAFIMCLSSVDAVLITTFNNSLSKENITLNDTRYLVVSDGTFFNSATMNLSTPINTSTCTQINTSQTLNCFGLNYNSIGNFSQSNWGNFTNITDGDLSTGTYPSAGPSGEYFANYSMFPGAISAIVSYKAIDVALNVVYRNITVPSGCFNGSQAVSIRLTSSFVTGDTRILCYNYSSSSQLQINAFTNGGAAHIVYDTHISWVVPVVNNLNVSIGNSQIFYSDGMFNTTNNKTNDFSAKLNSYLSTCTLVSGNCIIPFNFNATNSTNITYSDLQFTSNYFNYVGTGTTPGTVYETDSAQFMIDFDYDRSIIYQNQLTLAYTDNTTGVTTEYPAVKVLDIGTGTARWARAIDIPLLRNNTPQTNYYYWKMRQVNFNGTVYTTNIFDPNTGIRFNQSILPVNLTNCTFSSKTRMNFTAYDEINLSRITPYSFQGTFQYWLGGGDVYRNFSFGDNTKNEYLICTEPEAERFTISSQISYKDTGGSYTQRDYYIQGKDLGLQMRNYSLYLLNNTIATSFIQNVLDQNNNPIPNVLIYADRFYPSEGITRTVQVSKTGNDGNAFGVFQVETIDYNFTLAQLPDLTGFFFTAAPNIILQTPPQKIVPTGVPFTLYFQLGQNVTSPVNTFANLSNFNYNLYFNTTSNVTYYTWTDTSGVFQTARLLVVQNNFTGEDGTICNSASNSPIGILTCNLVGYNGTFTASIYVDRIGISETFLNNLIITLSSGGSYSKTMAFFGYFMSWLIIITAAMIGIYNISAGVVTTNVALWLVNFMGFITFGYTFLVGIGVISLIAIYYINR